MTFELSEDDYETLLLALGVAAGAASEFEKPLFWSFIRLANTINKDRPGWIPYEIPTPPPDPAAPPSPPPPQPPDPRDP